MDPVFLRRATLRTLPSPGQRHRQFVARLPKPRASRSAFTHIPCLRCFGTAHSLYPAKICYRYHPCHGAEVERIRYLRQGGDAPIVIVRLPDGRQLAIPEWMLSPEICERLRTEARPRISLDALIELRTLIAAQHSMVAGDRHGCAESSAGGQDAQPREAGRAAAQASLRRRRALDNIPRGGAETLPRALAGNVGQRSERTRREAR